MPSTQKKAEFHSKRNWFPLTKIGINQGEDIFAHRKAELT